MWLVPSVAILAQAVFPQAFGEYEEPPKLYAMLTRRFGPQPAAAKECRISSIKNPAVGGNDKPEQDVGSVHESDESHWKRHSGDPSSRTCCRCFYIRHKAGLRRDHPWLRPRPAHMGSHWRLGCEVCHCVRNCSKGEKRGKGFPWGINKYPNVWADYNFSNNGTGGLARIKNRIQAHRRRPGHTIASTSFRSVYGRGDDNDAPAICGPCAPAIGGQCAPALGGQVAPALGGQCTPALGGQVAPTLGGPFVLVPLADFAAGADQCIATGRAPQSWAEQVAAIPMTKLSRWRACPT